MESFKLSGPTRSYTFGGRRLEHWKGKEGLPEGRVAETWEVADRGSDQSIVQSGVWKGLALHDLLRQHPELLGSTLLDPLGRFPLLIKLLDVSGAPLPLHLHPDDTYATENALRDPGKPEAWVILEADPGAWIYLGVLPGTSREEYKKAILEGRGLGAMRALPARVGDVYYLPPNTPHAMTPGIVFYEVQRNSDLTVHVEQKGFFGEALAEDEWRRNVERFISLASLEPHPGTSGFLGRGPSLVNTPYFALEVLNSRSSRAISSRIRPEAWSCVRGQVRLSWPQGTLELERGETVLAPAGFEGEVEGNADLLVAYVPDRGKD